MTTPTAEGELQVRPWADGHCAMGQPERSVARTQRSREWLIVLLERASERTGLMGNREAITQDLIRLNRASGIRSY
jgi:hypothetical protein